MAGRYVQWFMGGGGGGDGGGVLVSIDAPAHNNCSYNPHGIQAHATGDRPRIQYSMHSKIWRVLTTPTNGALAADFKRKERDAPAVEEINTCSDAWTSGEVARAAVYLSSSLHKGPSNFPRPPAVDSPPPAFGCQAMSLSDLLGRQDVPLRWGLFQGPMHREHSVEHLIWVKKKQRPTAAVPNLLTDR